VSAGPPPEAQKEAWLAPCCRGGAPILGLFFYLDGISDLTVRVSLIRSKGIASVQFYLLVRFQSRCVIVFYICQYIALSFGRRFAPLIPPSLQLYRGLSLMSRVLFTFEMLVSIPRQRGCSLLDPLVATSNGIGRCLWCCSRPTPSSRSRRR